MTPEDELAILGRLAGAVAKEDQHAGLELSDRLVSLLGNPSDPERAARLRELADLLTCFGDHLRTRADDLDPVVIEGSHRGQ